MFRQAYAQVQYKMKTAQLSKSNVVWRGWKHQGQQALNYGRANPQLLDKAAEEKFTKYIPGNNLM